MVFVPTQIINPSQTDRWKGSCRPSVTNSGDLGVRMCAPIVPQRRRPPNIATARIDRWGRLPLTMLSTIMVQDRSMYPPHGSGEDPVHIPSCLPHLIRSLPHQGYSSCPHPDLPPWNNSVTSTDPHLTFTINSAACFMGRSTNNVCRTFKTMTRCGSLTISIRCVNTSPRLPHSLLNLAQTLDNLDPSGTAFRKCLRELRSICSAGVILPTSCTPLSDFLSVDPDPFAGGGYGDVYKGTLGDSKVCVKRMRVYTGDSLQKTAKVHY